MLQEGPEKPAKHWHLLLTQSPCRLQSNGQFSFFNPEMFHFGLIFVNIINKIDNHFVEGPSELNKLEKIQRVVFSLLTTFSIDSAESFEHV